MKERDVRAVVVGGDRVICAEMRLKKGWFTTPFFTNVHFFTPDVIIMSIIAIALIWEERRISVTRLTRFPTMPACESTFTTSLGPIAGFAETTSAGDIPGPNTINWMVEVVVVLEVLLELVVRLVWVDKVDFVRVLVTVLVIVLRLRGQQYRTFLLPAILPLTSFTPTGHTRHKWAPDTCLFKGSSSSALWSLFAKVVATPRVRPFAETVTVLVLVTGGAQQHLLS